MLDGVLTCMGGTYIRLELVDLAVTLIVLLSLGRTRTRTLGIYGRELGPPDLCHVVKSTTHVDQRDVSTTLALVSFKM
jgi:hypothetical protein